MQVLLVYRVIDVIIAASAMSAEPSYQWNTLKNREDRAAFRNRCGLFGLGMFYIVAYSLLMKSSSGEKMLLNGFFLYTGSKLI